ncbi:MAG: hypothetical protein COB02_17930 [Candidatus Cloacimonadota bacterium]|nr:MAG: hypothetical protein COB02_17930 [Candidatus Cloacimonadota bacterium]
MKVLIFVILIATHFTMSPFNDPWYSINTFDDAIKSMKYHNSKGELYDGLYALRIMVLKNKFKSIKMQCILAKQYKKIIENFPNDKHAWSNLEHNLQGVKKALKSNKLNNKQKVFYQKFYDQIIPILNRRKMVK